MAITRTYIYLGKVKTAHGVRHMVKGRFVVGDVADTYSQAARPTLTFSMLSKAETLVGLYPVGVVSGCMPCQVSLATNILTFGLFEGAAAGTVMAEKGNEAYGALMEFDAVVIGY